VRKNKRPPRRHLGGLDGGAERVELHDGYNTPSGTAGARWERMLCARRRKEGVTKALS
jgi:hypothetical protein